MFSLLEEKEVVKQTGKNEWKVCDTIKSSHAGWEAEYAHPKNLKKNFSLQNSQVYHHNAFWTQLSIWNGIVITCRVIMKLYL